MPDVDTAEARSQHRGRHSLERAAKSELFTDPNHCFVDTYLSILLFSSPVHIVQHGLHRKWLSKKNLARKASTGPISLLVSTSMSYACKSSFKVSLQVLS